ncbi:MAG: hypothetical protein ACXWEP_04335, partial [Halobacteriota archaeon]
MWSVDGELQVVRPQPMSLRICIREDAALTPPTVRGWLCGAIALFSCGGVFTGSRGVHPNHSISAAVSDHSLDRIR